jgi:VanZ family protein
VNSPRTPLSSVWTQWYRRALPAYWLFLFCVTHLPFLRLDLPIESSDKVAHLGAFGLLAFLFWRFVEALGRPLSGRFVYLAGFWLFAYAGFDEYLQQFVGRSTDLDDWLCDTAGITAVLLLLEWRRRKARPRGSNSANKTPSLPSP